MAANPAVQYLTPSPLRVSGNHRHLVRADGAPFFWLGDTAWELFHALTLEETEAYLDCRAEQGFTVIQAVALAELDGLTVPNAAGRLPLKQNAEGRYDPAMPDTDGDSYWDHVDRVLALAAERGLYIALLPTWGDKYHVLWGKGPDVFTPQNAHAYGLWLGARYRNRPNIIWVLGGDRPLKTRRHHEIISGMAAGLREGDGGTHLMTLHPSGESSSSDYVHDEPWLDFNMMQTGHGRQHLPSWQFLEKDYGLEPVKPVLDGEPRYEDHPVGFKPENGFFDAADVRQAVWWSVLAGGFGVTYGHHGVWCMNREPRTYFPLTWQQALRRPGAGQMRHLKALLLSRPLLERVPAQEMILTQYEGAGHLQAARGERYAFVYTPLGLPVHVSLDVLAGNAADVSWFNPRTGEWAAVGRFDNTGAQTFRPAMQGRGEDWVLVIDAVD